MKNTKYKSVIFLLPAVLLLSAVSCGKHSADDAETFPSDRVVRFNASVGASGASSDGVAEYDGKTLGLFLDYGAGDKYTQSNVQWKKDAGVWSVAGGSQMLWKDSRTPMDIYAYAPYQDGQDDASSVIFQIPADQTAGTGDADAVMCSVKGFDPAADLDGGRLNLAFRHALVRFKVVLTFGNQFDGEGVTVESVTMFEGSCKNVSMNLKAGIVTYSGTAMTDIKMHDCSTENETVFEAVCWPRTVRGQEFLKIRLSNGSTHTFVAQMSISRDFLSGGRVYTMKIRVGKNEVELDGEPTVTDWVEDESGAMDGQDGEAVIVTASIGPRTKTIPDGTADEQAKFTGPEGSNYPGDEIAVSELSHLDGKVKKTVTYRFDWEDWNPVPASDYLVWKAPVTYKACYPASAKDGFVLPTDQRRSGGSTATAKDFQKADYMTGEYVCDSKDRIPDDRRLRLAMQRRTALVSVDVDAQRVNSEFAGKKIYIIRVEQIQSGKSTIGTDGIAGGDPVNVLPGPYDTAYQDGRGVYSAIVVPCDGDASAEFLRISVGVIDSSLPAGSEVKTLTVTGRPAFEAGRHYTYRLTLGKDKMDLSGVTVSGWTDGDEIPGGDMTEQ